MFVRRLEGWNSISSRMMRNTCIRPLAGGINSSTRSEKSISPTLSLFPMAEKASVAQISVTMSRLVAPPVPNPCEPDTSTASIMVSSRSSSNTLMCGWLVLAVTFQSMLRTSSPGW